MHRYMTGKFTSQYRATVGADFLSTNISHNGKNYSLQVWDTAGQERFQSIGSAFYRGSDCCVIVYDITNKKVPKTDQKFTKKSKFQFFGICQFFCVF